MAILRSEFPATVHWRAADLRHELSRLHTVLARTNGDRSRTMQNVLNAKVEDLTTLTGTGPTDSAATLAGATVVESTVLTALDAVADGAFDITVDGVLQELRTMDFSTAATLGDVAAVIDTALGASASAVVDDSNILITSATTGATSTITEASDPAVGTYVGGTLNLETALGAVVTQGEDNRYAVAAAGLQAAVYPEFRDFIRMYDMAVDFAEAHNTPSAVLTSIAGQIQYALGEFNWTYA